jgi:hypothetical protein
MIGHCPITGCSNVKFTFNTYNTNAFEMSQTFVQKMARLLLISPAIVLRFPSAAIVGKGKATATCRRINRSGKKMA